MAVRTLEPRRTMPVRHDTARIDIMGGLLLAVALSGSASADEVRLGYFPQPQAFQVGCTRYLFDHDGSTVGCYPQSSGSYAVSKLENDQLDLAMVGSSPLAEAVARGVPLLAVYIALQDDSDQGLVVRKSILRPGVANSQCSIKKSRVHFHENRCNFLVAHTTFEKVCAFSWENVFES